MNTSRESTEIVACQSGQRYYKGGQREAKRAGKSLLLDASETGSGAATLGKPEDNVPTALPVMPLDGSETGSGAALREPENASAVPGLALVGSAVVIIKSSSAFELTWSRSSSCFNRLVKSKIVLSLSCCVGTTAAHHQHTTADREWIRQLTHLNRVIQRRHTPF